MNETPATNNDASQSEYAAAADRAFSGKMPDALDLSGLGSKFVAEFIKAVNERRLTELRWL